MTDTLPENDSERFFEEFCKDNSIVYKKIPRKDCPTPDYKIKIDDYLIYVEVKELEESDQTKELLSNLHEESKNTKFTLMKTDRRIRGEIDKARRQFKEIRNERTPTLLVIFENTKLNEIESIDVMTAMYGDEAAVLKFNKNTGERFLCRVKYGGNKKLTCTMNTSISAISILRKQKEKKPFLSVYHNIYAKYPICPAQFRNEQIKHYIIEKNKSDEFQDWKEI